MKVSNVENTCLHSYVNPQYHCTKFMNYALEGKNFQPIIIFGNCLAENKILQNIQKNRPNEPNSPTK